MKELFLYLKAHGSLPPGYDFQSLDDGLGIETAAQNPNMLTVPEESSMMISPRSTEADKELMEEAEQAKKDKEK